MIETLVWKGFTFTVKPFTLGGMYDFMEEVAPLQNSPRKVRGMFEIGCKMLLLGSTKEAQEFAENGELAKAVLSSTDVNEAKQFKSRVDFFCLKFAEQSKGVMQSEPNSTGKSAAKAQKHSRPKSLKVTKEEPAHSG